MLPIVAIVGRPNVGKSTLFNRFFSGRKAIVDREPGVTRDRNYGLVKGYEKTFLLVDTGGFNLYPDDNLLDQVRCQAMFACEEADAIIFMVDCFVGLCPSDMELAGILRKTKKPIYLTINKVDNDKRKENLTDFWSLGFDPLYPVSAEHKLGIDNLTDAFIKDFPRINEHGDQDALRVAVVGRPNVGKSTLINSILKEERLITDETPGTTRDSLDIPYETGGTKFILIDTAGIRRKSKIKETLEKYSVSRALRSIERSDVVLLLVDPIEGVTSQDTKITAFSHRHYKGLVVLVNKWDLMQKEGASIPEYRNIMKERLPFVPYAPIHFISALKGDGLDGIFPLITNVMDQSRQHISTGELNSFLKRMIFKHSPPLFKKREVKFFYCTQVGESPPTFLFFVNYPEGIKPAYSKYLNRQLHEGFDIKYAPIKFIFRKRV